MQVLFKSRHPQAIDLRALTERRVRFVLRRLGWMVLPDNLIDPVLAAAGGQQFYVNAIDQLTMADFHRLITQHLAVLPKGRLSLNPIP